MNKLIPCISRSHILEPKNKFFLFLCKNILEKLILYRRIFFQICYGNTKNLSSPFLTHTYKFEAYFLNQFLGSKGYYNINYRIDYIMIIIYVLILLQIFGKIEDLFPKLLDALSDPSDEVSQSFRTKLLLFLCVWYYGYSVLTEIKPGLGDFEHR